MRVLFYAAGLVCIGIGVIAKLIGIEAITSYLSKTCKEIQDLDYKIAEALHFMEDGETIFPNIRQYNELVRNVTRYVDGYYDVFVKYENLVLERGPKRWFPVHFIEDLAEERFNWTFKEFQTLKDLFKNSQNIYLSLKTKSRKWKSRREEGPTKIWEEK